MRLEPEKRELKTEKSSRMSKEASSRVLPSLVPSKLSTCAVTPHAREHLDTNFEALIVATTFFVWIPCFFIYALRSFSHAVLVYEDQSLAVFKLTLIQGLKDNPCRTRG